jgi:hypothetical protein
LIATWTLEDLARKLGIDDEKVVRNGVSFWASKGVLRGNRDGQWHVVERQNAEGSGQEVEMRHEVPEENTGIQSAEHGQAEQMRVFWQVSEDFDIFAAASPPHGHTRSPFPALV